MTGVNSLSCLLVIAGFMESVAQAARDKRQEASKPLFIVVVNVNDMVNPPELVLLLYAKWRQPGLLESQSAFKFTGNPYVAVNCCQRQSRQLPGCRAAHNAGTVRGIKL